MTKMFRFSILKNIILSTMAAGLLSGCEKPKSNQSEADWDPVPFTNKAILAPEDLEDEFLFGAQVTSTDIDIKVSGQTIQQTSVLTAKMDARTVRLMLSDDKKTLHIIPSLNSSSPLISFDVNDGFIDFATPNNVMNIVLTNSSTNSNLQTASSGHEVIKVQQDSNNLVVDTRYTIPKKDQNQSITIRYFLTRKSSHSFNSTGVSVTESVNAGMGYFGSNYSRSGKIRMFPEGPIVFHLKDFPEYMIEPAKTAILNWNQAFGSNRIQVKVAGSEIDVGDPRYHVVKWLDNGDSSLTWAGTAAPVFADAATGTVISGSTFINGGVVSKNYERHQITTDIKLKIDGLNLETQPGETPFSVPFFLDSNVSAEEYNIGYYSRTISHEIGHVLGLRHNFAGSYDVKRDVFSESIMDYMTRPERGSMLHDIGRYDIQAIQYGYYGIIPTPEEKEPFCTDDHVGTDSTLFRISKGWTTTIQYPWYCQRSDLGDPIQYAIDSLNNVYALFTEVDDGSISELSFSDLKTLAFNATKMIVSFKVDGTPNEDLIQAMSKICNLNATDFEGAINSNIKKLREDAKLNTYCSYL